MTTHAITESQRPRGLASRLLAGATASRWAPLPVVLSGTFMVVLDETRSFLHAALRRSPDIKQSAGRSAPARASIRSSGPAFLLATCLDFQRPDPYSAE